jgi:hypothetical protein
VIVLVRLPVAVGDDDAVGVEVCDGVLVLDWVAVDGAVPVTDGCNVAVIVLVRLSVAVGVGVADDVLVFDGVKVDGAVAVADEWNVAVIVPVRVSVAVRLGVADDVLVLV